MIAALTECNINEQYDLSTIKQMINSVCKCSLKEEDIITIFSELESGGEVEHVNRFVYKLVKRQSIPDFQTLSEPVWKEFSSYLKNEIPKFDPFIHKDAKTIFNSVLLKVLSGFTISKPLETQMESVQLIDIDRIIKEELNKVYFPDDFGYKFPKIIVAYFNSKSPQILEFVFTCYYGLINIDLVTREQEMPNIDFGNEINCLIVDSNFIISLLCTTDSTHPLSAALVGNCIKSNIPLYYMPCTKEEVNSLIKAVNIDMSGFTSKKRSLKDNQLIMDHIKLNISWREYSIYLDSWEQILESKFAIKMIDKIQERCYNPELIADIKNRLKLADDFRCEERLRHDSKYCHRFRLEDNYNHDAVCIGCIIEFKNQAEISEKKRGPWFLTYDSLLSFVNISHNYFDNFGHVISPRMLINYILAYSKIEYTEEDKEEMAIAILKYSLKQKSDFLTLDEYSRLVAEKLNLPLANAELIKEIFINSAFNDELEKSLNQENSEDPDTIAFKILTSPTISELVGKIAETTHEKEAKAAQIRKLGETVQELKSKLCEQDAYIKGLEQKDPVNLTVNVNQNISNNITFAENVPQYIKSLIDLLESQNAFEEGIIEKPPKHFDIGAANKWLSGVKTALENVQGIKEGVLTLLPFITSTLASLSQV